VTRPTLCSYLTSLWAVVMSLTLNEFALLVGILTGVGTYLTLQMPRPQAP